MIKENQTLFNQLNIVTDGLILFLSLPVAFWLRFFVLPNGVITVPLSEYILPGILLMLVQLFTYACFGLYGTSFRKSSIERELTRLWIGSLLIMALLLSALFIFRGIHYSRVTLAIFFFLSAGLLTCKRIALRLFLRRYRQKGYNLKHVIIVGSGKIARSYYDTTLAQRQLGYLAAGYISDTAEGTAFGDALPRLGSFDELDTVLESMQPDEVISAIEISDYHRTPQIIEACEKAGIKLSIIPFYAEYMSSNPQFDSIGNIPLFNIRRIPLDNWGNAFCKRLMDIIGSLLLLIVSSPALLICALGVRFSSPGPIIFRQERVGLNKKNFYMYKFRSMRVNDEQDTRWSTDRDDRKTAFGAFMRKYSLDELPQFVNVLKGDMSLVGPRPELPHHVNHFKDEIPLYMVKHQVRPGITGWAQVNGLRGDTSIKERIEFDIHYIEHWSLLMDLKILFLTVFGGKFMNSEKLH